MEGILWSGGFFGAGCFLERGVFWSGGFFGGFFRGSLEGGYPDGGVGCFRLYHSCILS